MPRHVFPMLCALVPVMVVSSGLASWDMENEKTLLLKQIADTSETLFTELFCVLDSDHDGVLTQEEAARNMATMLGKEPDRFYMLWDEEIICYRDDPTRRYKPGIRANIASAAYLAIGRTDWKPCRLSAILNNRVEFSSGGWQLETTSEGSLVHVGTYFLLHAFDIEDIYWDSHLDTDKDGCLSPAEWDSYFDRFYTAKGSYLAHTAHDSEYGNLVPKSPHLKQYYQPEGLNASFKNGTCFGRLSYTTWSVKGILEGFWSFINATEQCKTTQLMLQPEQGQEALDATVILVLVLGFVCIISAGFCAAYCRSRLHRKTLEHSRQIQNLLKAKIDAWSAFDSKLRTKTETLEKTFIHVLALENFAQDIFNLVDIVHPEDISAVQSMRDQLNIDQHPGAIASMAKVHLQHGATGQIRRHYDIKYICVELLMAWGAQSSIILGITSLGEMTCERAESLHVDLVPGAKALSISADTDCESVAAASSHSKREVILNGSEVTGFNESEAATFRSMEVLGPSGGQITRIFSEFKTNEIHSAFAQEPFEQGSKTTVGRNESPAEASSSVSGNALAGEKDWERQGQRVLSL